MARAAALAINESTTKVVRSASRSPESCFPIRGLPLPDRATRQQIRSDRKVALFVLPVSLFAGGVVVVASESTITEVHGCTVLSTGTEEHDYLRNRRGTYEVQAVSTSCGDFVVNGDLTTGRFWDDLVWAQLETGRTYDFTLSGLGLQRLNIVELREIASPQ